MTTLDALDQRVLDNPAWAALTGPHARFAEVYGQAARYQSEVAPFHALSDPADPRSWADLAILIDSDGHGPGGVGPGGVGPGGVGPGGVGPGGVGPGGLGAEVALAGAGLTAFHGWEVVGGVQGVQFIDVSLRSAADPEALVLTADDVPEMLDLVARTQPGPFRTRTVELGTYLGLRRDGKLIAMAGERLHPPGWTEISAVCTDPAYRGQGLATRLVRAVAAGIRARGETPFLHTAATNTSAIRLYESIGFRLRRKTVFGLYRRRYP